MAHSFKVNGDSDTSSGEVNMAMRFKTLGQKKAQALADLTATLVPLVILDSPLAP